MEQLSPLDTAFLNMETGSTPMHVGSLGIYDQSTVEGKLLGFKDILKFFESRLHKVPALRSRMVEVPMGLDYPYWISDPDFDIEFHLRHIALPHPGDWRQLCIQVARIHSRPLDMGRPPWEIYVIEGLDNIEGLPKGCFGVVAKLHHALVDGAFGAQLMAALHDLSAVPAQVKIDKPWVVDRVPTGIELLSRAAFNGFRNFSRKGQALTKHVLPGSFNIARRMLLGVQDLDSANMLMKAPRTRFNNKVSAHRVFEAVDFDLNEIKALKNAHAHASVNDVMVAIVAGALRRYLKIKGELPEESMTALLPISIRSDAKNNAHSVGNQISFMFPKVYTNIEDPVERLDAVAAVTTKGKRQSQNDGGSVLLETAQLLPTTVTNLLLRTALKYNVAHYIKPLFNTVITNVPGPQLPLYFAGAKLVNFYGTGISYDTMGLFHIIFSYNGRISLSVTCCRNMMPDPAFYADCLRHSMRELKKALLPQSQQEPRTVISSKTTAVAQVTKEKATSVVNADPVLKTSVEKQSATQSAVKKVEPNTVVKRRTRRKPKMEQEQEQDQPVKAKAVIRKKRATRSVKEEPLKTEVSPAQKKEKVAEPVS